MKGSYSTKAILPYCKYVPLNLGGSCMIEYKRLLFEDPILPTIQIN